VVLWKFVEAVKGQNGKNDLKIFIRFQIFAFCIPLNFTFCLKCLSINQND